jgi:hypothetical protein
MLYFSGEGKSRAGCRKPTQEEQAPRDLQRSSLLEVEVNRVGGSAELLHDTSGSLTVFHNKVTNNLECTANKPPPIGSSNTAKRKQGQCALL